MLNKPPVYISPLGLSEKTVREISGWKNEPAWMLDYRLRAWAVFKKFPLPSWGPPLDKLNFQNLRYFIRSTDRPVTDWKDLPPDIRRTYSAIGIPQAEKKYLAGVSAQYESEVVYQKLKHELDRRGIIFTDTDSALKKYPELFREYFGRLVPADDNKFAALNSAVWSGGTFIYIPKNVRLELPLQAYFRINAANMGQFERTLIIAEEGSFLEYIEGCTAPVYLADALHAAVVEIFVKKGARLRYSTVQNWSENVYNLVTKRMTLAEESIGEWVDGNLGSKVTMKYPALIFSGRRSRGEILSLAAAGKGQDLDAGGKVIHLAGETSSRIISKSVVRGGGRSTYRGLVHVAKTAENVKTHVECDALHLDAISESHTFPTMDIRSLTAQAEHEASITSISEKQLFYLQSRGIPADQAQNIIVNGFMEPIVSKLPLEYAVELNRLISWQLTKKTNDSI